MTRSTRISTTLHHVTPPVAIAAAVLLVAGCGGGVAKSAAEPAAPKAPAAAAGPVLNVTGAEFKFAPVALTAPAGKTTIRFVNKGVVEHDFSIDALKVHIVAAPGKTTEATVVLKAGTYKSTCTVPGHLQSGMAGTLTVK
jgi:uncharacterized cupredoxin-like copper-binding protein